MFKRIHNIFGDEGLLSLLGYVLSFHALAFGISFALDTDDARRTILYRSLNNFPLNLVTPKSFGIILAFSGFITFIGYFARSLKVSKSFVKYSSYVQFVIYLFMTFLYITNHSYWYAAIVAAPWVPFLYLVSNTFYQLPRYKTLDEQRAEWGLPFDNDK